MIQTIILYFKYTYTMNVLPAGFTPPIGVRRTITDECFGMWASSSVYSAKHDKKFEKTMITSYITKICPQKTLFMKHGSRKKTPYE